MTSYYKITKIDFIPDQHLVPVRLEFETLKGKLVTLMSAVWIKAALAPPRGAVQQGKAPRRLFESKEIPGHLTA